MQIEIVYLKSIFFCLISRYVHIICYSNIWSSYLKIANVIVLYKYISYIIYIITVQYLCYFCLRKSLSLFFNNLNKMFTCMVKLINSTNACLPNCYHNYAGCVQITFLMKNFRLFLYRKPIFTYVWLVSAMK